MTDEEKAEERYCKTCKKKNNCFHNCDVFIEYTKGLAEGRKEQENKDKGFCESFCMKGGRITELEKENAELKKDKEWLDNTNNEQTEVILKLNEQIEKMKCCSNCSNFNSGNCKFSLRIKGDVTTFAKMHEDFFCINYDKWELAE